MSLQLFNGKFQPIEVKEEAIGVGAEGSVHEVLYPSSWVGYVVKIYADTKKAPLKQEKIEYLIKHKPKLKNPLSVIFPEDVVYQNGKFIGFLMKKAQGDYDLTSLCTYGKSSRLPQEWHYKYNRDSPQGLKNRLRICYNIAAAVNQVHRSKKFTFVDIKPENIKISFDAKVSIVDIDSIAIANGEELIFPAEKFTPEYSPAEYNETNLKKDVVDETWDRFSISILFYKILFGIHPYAGTAKGNYAHLNSNEQKIIEGLFSQGGKSEHFEIIPEPHKKFKEAPHKVRKLFMNCFDEGHNLPSKRPSAAEWCKALVSAKPKNYFFKKLFQPKPKLGTPAIKTKKQTSKEKILSTMRVSPTSGIFPAVMVFLVLMISSFGTINYVHYQKTKKIIKAGDSDFGKDVKETSNDIRTKPYEKYKDKDYFGFPREGVSKVLHNGKWGYLLVKSQKMILETKYDWVHQFKDGRGRVRQNGKFGFVNKSGKFVIPFKFTEAHDFRDGKALVLYQGKYMFIDLNGNKLFELNGDKIYHFQDGLALLKRNGKYGFINERGHTVIPIKYDMAYPFKEGLAAAKYEDKWGYIDSQGKVVIPFEWDEVTSFSDGVASVILGGEEFFIDDQGLIIQIDLQE